MPRLRYHAWLIAKAATRFILPVFPLPVRSIVWSTKRKRRRRRRGAKKVVKRIIEITPGASPAFTTIYLHRRYIKESLGIFTRGTEGSPPCLRYSRFPLSVLVLHARMQSAWTISRSSLEKGARGERGRSGERGWKRKKEKEREERRGERGGGRKTPSTSNVRHYFFLFYSFRRSRKEERERKRVFFDSQSYTSRDNASRAFTCVNREGNR